MMDIGIAVAAFAIGYLVGRERVRIAFCDGWLQGWAERGEEGADAPDLDKEAQV